MAELDLENQTLGLVDLCRDITQKGGCIAITGHDSPDADSIISAVMMRRFLEKFNISSVIRFGTRPDGVTERDMRELGVLDGIYFDGFLEDDRLLLVDHHKSFYKNCVIASVDHHTTLPEPEGKAAIVIRASSCGRVIFDMARSCGVEDSELEMLAIYSVYLDTQSCRSPKFNASDTQWLERGIEKYGIDRAKIEKMGFCLNDASEDAETLAMYGYKKYSFGARPSFSTCIQIDTADGRWNERIEKIVNYLREKLTDEGGAIWAFVVNMPAISRSDIYFIGRDGVVDKLVLDRLASRSRDVIPIVSIAE